MASFRKRNDKWEYRIKYIDPVSGKKREKSKGNFRTKKEAQIAASEVELNIDNDFFEKNDSITVEEYLDIWFNIYKHTIKESSWKSRQDSIKAIKKRIGKIQIKKINLSFYQNFINQMGEHYARNTLIAIHQVFSMMMKQAVRDQYFKVNPIVEAKLPREKYTETEKEDIEYWEKEDLNLFLNCLRDKNQEKELTLFLLLAFSGLRIGEAICLKWDDIDFESATLNVNKTLFQKKGLRNEYVLTEPKSQSSKRKVPIPPQVIKQLKSWRHHQNQLKMKNRSDYTDLNFIFSDKTGHPTPARNFGYKLNTYAKKAGVSKITPHGLRHTYTALLIEAEIDVKEIQLRLGHASIKTTLDVYAHISKDKQIKSIKQFNDFAAHIF
ncbi:tyrosine-type recombinase/integrase [Peribacillus sp. JNUCC41]|uniref:site-specific integrase n=1 Tax=Peribacillus sp. JNUCC41 TaxID=2778370 RepID=UPI00177E0F3F|nr:tyrosine-type recombinase/integrase [Brevibacillus sp. JNUCC-41]QOS90249.1 site-specific integrase [Brevibacillus sp. JNUCC-41]